MKRSQLISLTVHLCALFLLLVPLGKVPPPPKEVAPHEVLRLAVPPLPELKSLAGTAGGGGGPAQLTPASLGSLPRVEPRPLIPPALRPETTPILEIEPAVELTVNVDPSLQKLPQLGSPWAAPGPPSAGNGKDGYLGDGSKGPMGPGIGNKGVGPGEGPGLIGSSRCGPPVGPSVVYKVEPEFSEEARKAKLHGSILIRAIVNESGAVLEPVVQRGLGLGLDEKALESVAKWRFKPGMRNCKPAAMPALFEVNFHLL